MLGRKTIGRVALISPHLRTPELADSCAQPLHLRVDEAVKHSKDQELAWRQFQDASAHGVACVYPYFMSLDQVDDIVARDMTILSYLISSVAFHA